MKFYPEIVPHILMAIESISEDGNSNEIDMRKQLKGEQQEFNLSYHLKKLREAGFVDYTEISTWDGSAIMEIELTIAGHDYLDEKRREVQLVED